MKLTKKIVGLGLAVSIMISGLNAVPERVKASGVGLRNKTKVIMSKTVYGKKAKKVKVSAKNKKAHLAYEKLLWKIDSNRYDYAKDCFRYVDNLDNVKTFFAYHDFNKDGIDELCVCFVEFRGSYFDLIKAVDGDTFEKDYHFSRYNVYTYYNNKAVKIVDYKKDISYDFESPYFTKYENGGGYYEIIKGKLVRTHKIENYAFNDKTGGVSFIWDGKRIELESVNESYAWKKGKHTIGYRGVSKKNLKRYRNSYNSSDFKGGFILYQ